jgi:hypothetical protein
LAQPEEESLDKSWEFPILNAGSVDREDSMKRVYIPALSLLFLALLSASATIIDVPDDYETIQEGIDASTDGDTVLVQPGTYAENVNFNGHNMVLGSLFLTTGDTTYIPLTIIDGNSAGPVVTFANGEDTSAVITGFTIRNGSSAAGGGIYCTGAGPIISYNLIMDNNSPWFGGGIYCEAVSPAVIRNNVITGNSADWGGGGLYVDASEPLLKQNVIVHNSTVAYGGGLLCVNYGNPEIVNCVFSENGAGYGGAMSCQFTSYPILNNTIMWADSALMLGQELFSDDASSPTFTYCDIQDTYRPGEGNVDIDPLFRDPENGDFHLMISLCGDPGDSPVIDAGDPDVQDGILDCAWGLGDIRSDMGAYGGGDSVMVEIEDETAGIPDGFGLSQNYPNPFNAATVIRYALPEPSDVKIEIYDILGRRVETLIHEEHQAGYHRVAWDAADYSSGMYFYRILAGKHVAAGKMLLLK